MASGPACGIRPCMWYQALQVASDPADVDNLLFLKSVTLVISLQKYQKTQIKTKNVMFVTIISL